MFAPSAPGDACITSPISTGPKLSLAQQFGKNIAPLWARRAPARPALGFFAFGTIGNGEAIIRHFSGDPAKCR
jgi:hypothetical protein